MGFLEEVSSSAQEQHGPHSTDHRSAVAFCPADRGRYEGDAVGVSIRD